MERIFFQQTTLLALVFSTLTMVCFGQPNESVLSDKNSVASGKQQYQEKIFVHLDRGSYVAGEIMWFKIYTVDAETLKPSELSKIVYVEMLNAENEPVSQLYVELRHGMGDGSVYLPVSLASGNYKVRAYTNWMKNFGAETFFEQVVPIVNLLDGSPLSSGANKAIDIGLFPEGGNLVQDVTNTVGIKVTDKQGRGVKFTGAVVGSGDTIVRFNSLRFGMGRFSFSPVRGRNYKAIVKANGSVFEKTLPEITEAAMSIHVESTDDQATIGVTSASKDGVFTLVVHSRKKLKIAERFYLRGGKAELLLNKEQLERGISCITVFNQHNQPVAERLLFRRPDNILRIDAMPRGTTVDIRAKNSVSIKTNSTDSVSNLSMAIFRIDSLSDTSYNDILSYYWLSSELSGNVENASYYFQDNADVMAADNLMLTQGWRTFRWSERVEKDTILEFLPEYEGHIIRGKIKNTTGSTTAFLSSPGQDFSLFNGEVRNGEITFITKNIEGPSTLVVQRNAGPRLPTDLTFVNPYFKNYSKFSVPQLNFSPVSAESLSDRSVAVQVHNGYAKEQLNRFYDQHVRAPFFGKPPKTYLLDDYTRFPTLIEVMTEYVPEVAIRKNQNGYVFKMLESHEAGYFEGEPLVLMDGIPVKNSGAVIATDPLKIRKLDVVNSRFSMGNTIYNGVVSYTSYDDDHSWVPLDSGAVTINYEGLQAKRIFYTPSLEALRNDTRTPDFRTLLYWSPDIVNGKGEVVVDFVTSDLPGKYIGIIQGSTVSGSVGSTSFKFSVKR